MGIDSPNICHIVHWTPPESVEMYVQQSGCGGRDGERTVAVIYYNEGDLTNNVTGEMAAYCVNRDRKCRRFLLMSEFDHYDPADTPEYEHDCCDVCATTCKCQFCELGSVMEMDTTATQQSIAPSTAVSKDGHPNKQTSKKLREMLLEYRFKACQTTFEGHIILPLLVGIEFCSGLSDDAIKSIAQNYDTINNPADILELGVYDVHCASEIFEIIQCCLH